MSLLDKCFKGTHETPPRLKKTIESIPKAEEHLEKANKNLLASHLMNENKFFDWTITCSYYAMYHATMASMWLLGLEARSHECAITAFETFYVKQRKASPQYYDYVKKCETLSKKYADSLEYAKTERIKASYGLSEITSYEASKTLSEAREFVAEIMRLVSNAKGITTIAIK